MGTLATMNDSDVYTLTNQASGLALGIAGQSQVAVVLRLQKIL